LPITCITNETAATHAEREIETPPPKRRRREEDEEKKTSAAQV
jgi:hypothetical protein